MLISWIIPICCQKNPSFFRTPSKRFCISLEQTRPHRIHLQIHFTDSVSQLTYLQKYLKGLCVLFFKQLFLKCRHFSTKPNMWWATSRTDLFNHYRNYIFSVSTFQRSAAWHHSQIYISGFSCIGKEMKGCVCQNTSNVKEQWMFLSIRTQLGIC